MLTYDRRSIIKSSPVDNRKGSRESLDEEKKILIHKIIRRGKMCLFPKLKSN